nr:immunoglobulin heavy chain junction region [Macaca mulatta]
RARGLGRIVAALDYW